jgi:ERCC4-related helicase
VFAEGLASSYEAFLETRAANRSGSESPVDDDEDHDQYRGHGTNSAGHWYLDQLEWALQGDAGPPPHPKLAATVRRAIDAWRRGEKVLVFCHYLQTGRVLRQRISSALNAEILRLAGERFQCEAAEAEQHLDRLGKRFFDEDSPARRQCDAEAGLILDAFPGLQDLRSAWLDIVRRNIRTPSFLARFFTLGIDGFGEREVSEAFHRRDESGLSLRGVLEHFFRFLHERCGKQDRENYLVALQKVQTGSHSSHEMQQSFDADELDGPESAGGLLPNVRLANGKVRAETRRRLMLTFNTPFYPEVLIASSVMAEGVDLHRNCRYVIHHDLCWNPSTLEQRTGRVDRIGAKAEICGKPIHIYLPYIAATQDEKMYRVVMDRERWFGVVMGENYQVDARSTEKLAERIPLPDMAAAELAFHLEVPTAPDDVNGRVGSQIGRDM